ncbi:alkaline phosphatase-like protein [Ascodesmis nigricans]|uniref:Alkaline phosphatase n=1 Tax=Ascodesmis nigricans TaxID=341454 RepID=A0A4S2MQE5_9PEZI|nr:alkaline phosphatase-like protein [Ascodesmis nigricans]
MKVSSLFLFSALLLLDTAAASPSAKPGKKKKKDWGNKKPKNFIMVIPDGFGPTSELMARDYVHWKDNSTTMLPVDGLIIGQTRTKSSDSYVTDSSASATAYSAGIKTYNGGVGVDSTFTPYATVLESLSLQGFKTGLVVTSRITHATPASYIAHTHHRDLESNIALQLIGHAHPLGRRVDLILGGGSCHFLPSTTPGSCRPDSTDAFTLAKGLGYNVFQTRSEFDKNPKLPYLGLFTRDHMSYEIDRDSAKEPSLKEMAIRALNDLYSATRKSKQGFFVMVEASRIDHAGHANDPVAHLHDILAFNEAMDAIREWIDGHEDSPTTMVATADHECGGLTVGGDIPQDPSYWYAPSWFAGSRASAGVLAKRFLAFTGSDEEKKKFLREEVLKPYGISDATDAEIQEAAKITSSGKLETWLGKAMGDRARVYWSTGGHTGADVTLYGYGPKVEEFAGHRENTEVADFIVDLFGLNLESVSRKLRKNQTWVDEWVKPAKGETMKASVHGH